MIPTLEKLASQRLQSGTPVNVATFPGIVRDRRETDSCPNYKLVAGAA